jgi:hypothetical protein
MLVTSGFKASSFLSRASAHYLYFPALRQRYAGMTTVPWLASAFLCSSDNLFTTSDVCLTYTESYEVMASSYIYSKLV